MCGWISQGPEFAARDGVGQGEGVAAEHVDVPGAAALTSGWRRYAADVPKENRDPTFACATRPDISARARS